MHPRRPVFGLRRIVFYAFFCYFVGKKLQNHERMKQKTHYSEALAYLRDYCLRHGRLMHFSHGDIFEAEGVAARLFGYIENGSFHYLVRNYEGDESTVETVAAGDLVGCYPYCLDGDAAPVTIRADKSSTATHSDDLTAPISNASTPSEAPTYRLRSPLQALSSPTYREEESRYTPSFPSDRKGAMR